MRLFAALDLDDDARTAIAILQKRISNALDAESSLKWVSSSHMHLTLAFLGEVAEPGVPAIVDALALDIDAPPFTARLQGLGVFPSRRAPRVLWLAVGQGRDQIIELQRKVATRLEALGVPLERRPFHPHLTLARWRTSRPVDADRALSVDSPAATPVAGMNVDHVTLYRSRLSPAGSTYTALARATLT